MAVTKIWKVTDRFDKLINYAMNPEKTDVDIEKYHPVGDLIKYAADGDKTEKCFYVTGVNCIPENAIKTFGDTQRRWNKTTGTVAFHMYQSFAEGEVDAKTAHEIGVKLAKELFEDRFEVVVATHLNTKHFHNHFVLNAVSFVDGKKYNDCNATYRLIRETSDRLCSEYGLSVIKNPKGKGSKYAEWKAEQNGQPTLRGSIRSAIDIAIKCSTTKSEFINVMTEMGFIIDQSGKHPKIKHNGTERFVRFDTLGPDYSVKEIIERIYANTEPATIKLPEQEDPRHIFEGETEPVEIMRYIPLYRSYNRAITAAKERPYTNFRIYYLVRQDISAKRLYEDTLDLLLDHGLKTGQDVIDYKAQAMKQIEDNIELRRQMRMALQRAKRHGDTVEADKARFNIGVYNLRLSKLRREVTTCDEVLERSSHVRDNLKRIQDGDYRGELINRKGKEEKLEFKR